MLEKVNIESQVAVYAQIENQVCFAIASGQLNAGDQLPSVRELSERLEVNPNTVAKAYRDLEVMGLVYTRRGMGVFVNRGVEAKCRANCLRQLAERINDVSTEARTAGIPLTEVLDLAKLSYESNGELYGALPPQVESALKKKTKTI